MFLFFDLSLENCNINSDFTKVIRNCRFVPNLLECAKSTPSMVWPVNIEVGGTTLPTPQTPTQTPT